MATFLFDFITYPLMAVPKIFELISEAYNNATVNVNYGGGQVATMCRQIITSNMSAGGDSGSLLLDIVKVKFTLNLIDPVKLRNYYLAFESHLSLTLQFLGQESLSDIKMA